MASTGAPARYRDYIQAAGSGVLFQSAFFYIFHTPPHTLLPLQEQFHQSLTKGP